MIDEYLIEYKETSGEITQIEIQALSAQQAVEFVLGVGTDHSMVIDVWKKERGWH